MSGVLKCDKKGWEKVLLIDGMAEAKKPHNPLRTVRFFGEDCRGWLFSEWLCFTDSLPRRHDVMASPQSKLSFRLPKSLRE